MKKGLLPILLSCIFLCLFSSRMVLAAETPAGSGTAVDPYIIVDEQQLKLIASGEITNAFTAHYKMANDIAVTGEWVPICNATTPFKGSFDGNNFKITGLKITNSIYTASTYTASGLFGVIGSGGTVKNLGVDVFISGKEYGYTGGLAGSNEGGIIENCFASGSVSGKNGQTGGLVGQSLSGKIQSSYATASVNDTDSGYAGGLVGRNRSVVQYVYASGTVSGHQVGGLVGNLESGTIKYSYANGSVNGSHSSGGLVGENNYGEIQYSYSVGAVTGTGVGALVGYQYNGRVLFSYYYTGNGSGVGFGATATQMKQQASYYGWDFDTIWSISSDKNNGYPYINLRGTAAPIDIEGSGTDAEPYLITSEQQLFALTSGQIAGTSTFSSCYRLANDIVVTARNWTPIGGNSYAAFTGTFDGNNHKITGIKMPSSYFSATGLFGTLGTGGVIKNLGVDVFIEGSSNGYTGGLAGSNEGGTIQNCYATGSVTGKGGNIGGLLGRNYSGKTQNSYAAASVTDTVSGDAGGLVGYNRALIQCSYASGTVNGYEDGGLVGQNSAGTIQYSYASGSVNGNYYCGGLVGQNNSGTIQYSYASGNVSGNSNTGGGLVGYNYYGRIEYSYTVGSVTGSTIGGLVGTNINSNILFSYYYTIGGQAGAGFGATATQMKQQSSYYGWDFDTIWSISSGQNNGYPYINLRGTAAPIDIEGSGTDAEPYLINNEQQLFALTSGQIAGASTFAAYYKLANDIVVTARNWTPIGGNSFAAFTGTFDGNNHKITGIKMPSSYFSATGLFGTIGTGGVIKNLGVDVFIEGSSNGYTGGLAGSNEGGTIQNCYATGSVTGKGGNIGGLLGRNYSGKTQNSYATVSVTDTASGDAGGLVGYNKALIQCSYASGTVNGYEDGGLVGQNSAGTIQYSYANGSVNGIYYCGGLVGQNNSGTIQYSYASGNVSGNSNTGGGLVGYSYYGRIEYSYTVGSVTGSTIGGLVGISTNSNILFSYYYTIGGQAGAGFAATATQMKQQSSYYGWDFDTIWSISSGQNNGYPYINLRGTAVPIAIEGSGTDAEPYLINNEQQLFALTSGQIAGTSTFSSYYRLDNDIAISSKNWTPIGGNSYAAFTGTFDGNNHKITGIKIPSSYFSATGLFGTIGTGGVIKNLGVDVFIEGSTNGYTGGLAGSNDGGTIQNCYATGSVTGKGGNIGGLLGRNYSGSTQNSYAAASVRDTVSGDAGGLVGYNRAIIQYSYASGTVNGYEDGGLVGQNNSGTIQYSYASGSVNGNCYSGGLVGQNYSGIIQYSFASGNVSGNNNTGGGLVGYSYYGKIEYSYAVGSVTGGTAGGLVGYSTSGTITSAYYDLGTTGRNDTGKGTGLSTANMKLKASYSEWDFDTVWNMGLNLNRGYPYLRWQQSVPVTPALIYQGASLENQNRTIVLSFNKTIISNVSDQLLRQGISFAVDGTAFNALNTGDTVDITGSRLSITFQNPLSGSANKIRLAANLIKDMDGNIQSDAIETVAIIVDTVNQPPTAAGIMISGVAQIGRTLAVTYVFNDKEGDPEGTSIFKWYRADSPNGQGKTEIPGANTCIYTLAAADIDKYLFFEVTPVAQSGNTTGGAVLSSATSQVAAGQKLDECFIATAAFGTKFAPAVVMLRHFRDQFLLTNKWGTAFVEFYYRNSPPIAAYIAHRQPLKIAVRVMLAPFIGAVYMIYHPFIIGVLLSLVLLVMIYRLRFRNRTI